MEKKILRKHNKETFDTLRGRYLTAITDIMNGNIDKAFEQPRTSFDTDEEDNDVDDAYNDGNLRVYVYRRVFDIYRFKFVFKYFNDAAYKLYSGYEI